MTFTIHGAPRTKKNSQRILTGRGGRRFIAQSSQHNAWANAAVLQLRSRWRTVGVPIESEVNMRALVYRERNGGDLLNYLAAVSDALESAGVVANDKLIVSVDGSRLLIDKARPRVVVELTVVRSEEFTNVMEALKSAIPPFYPGDRSRAAEHWKKAHRGHPGFDVRAMTCLDCGPQGMVG